jgi:hypothetical protein
MCCVDLPESTLFSSFGVICVELLPSPLSGEFSMENTCMNISGLFSRYKVCSFSDRNYNSSLVTVGYQLYAMAPRLHLDLVIWHARGHVVLLVLRNTVQSLLHTVQCILVVTLYNTAYY